MVSRAQAEMMINVSHYTPTEAATAILAIALAEAGPIVPHAALSVPQGTLYRAICYVNGIKPQA